MNPAAIALVISLVEEAIKVTPGLIIDIKALFGTTDPTPADWAALRAKVLGQSFAILCPDAPLPEVPKVIPITVAELTPPPADTVTDQAEEVTPASRQPLDRRPLSV